MEPGLILFALIIASLPIVLPIVSLVDEPGFMIGPEAEKAATIRHGVATLFAVMQSTVPWVSVIVRKVYGVAGAAHFGPGSMVFAWPSAESGASLVSCFTFALRY